MVLALFGLFQAAGAQNGSLPQDAAQQQDATTQPLAPTTPPLAPVPEKASHSETNSSALVLGPGDEVEVTVYGAPDLSGHTRVSSEGNISIPLIGYVRIAGLSSSEAEGAIEAKLRQFKVVNDPQVSVYVKEYSRGEISVAGEVNRPGVYSAMGPHRLFDILQTAGGLSEKASGSVTISHQNDENKPVTVELSKDPAEMVRSNIVLHPGDTVFVAKAPMVYVLGEVIKPGAYVLNSTGAITVLQLVAAAGGPTHAAAVGGARMLRRTPSGLQESRVPLKALLRGKGTDIPVSPEDIIFVPSSRVKDFIAASSVVATSAATAAVYRVY
ncbi:MAG: polysaccharide biosynthesis/export family protein [Terriglobales bacterium]|jgi:polysaccharide export outer membrane protein